MREHLPPEKQREPEHLQVLGLTLGPRELARRQVLGRAQGPQELAHRRVLELVA